MVHLIFNWLNFYSNKKLIVRTFENAIEFSKCLSQDIPLDLNFFFWMSWLFLFLFLGGIDFFYLKKYFFFYFFEKGRKDISSTSRLFTFFSSIYLTIHYHTLSYLCWHLNFSAGLSWKIWNLRFPIATSLIPWSKIRLVSLVFQLHNKMSIQHRHAELGL